MNQRRLPRWLPGLLVTGLLGAALLLWKPDAVTEILRGSFANVRTAIAQKTTQLEATLRRPSTLATENQALEAENAALLARLAWLETQVSQEVLAEQAGSLQEQHPDYRFLPVRVGGRDVTGGIWVIGEETLPYPAVLTDANGCLIATVTQVSGKTALIQPITAEGFAAACWVGSGQEAAMLSGNGTDCIISELSRSSHAAVGDVVVTNGLGGVIPAGLTVGTLESISPASDGSGKVALLQPIAQLDTSTLFVVEAVS